MSNLNPENLSATNENSKAEIQILPIGIFDSGVGGLTVYRALHERLPNERFVYLGDTARVPYGTKSLATVERYAIENSEFLASVGIKILVVACNTASALALPKIRERIGIETVGVIGPGARRAVEITKEKINPKIGVIATEATISSCAYADAIERANSRAEVFQKPARCSSRWREEDWRDEPETRSIAEKYLKKIVEARVDALVLGCTHYPILREVIRKIVGANVRLIDSGEATAEEVRQLLKDKNLANANPPPREMPRRLCDDLDHFYVTDAADRFARVAERFLGVKPAKLEAIEVFGTDKLKED